MVPAELTTRVELKTTRDQETTTAKPAEMVNTAEQKTTMAEPENTRLCRMNRGPPGWNRRQQGIWRPRQSR